MAYQSFRGFLARLEAEGEIAHVEPEVDLTYEIGAICFKTLRARGPALVFDRPRGGGFPLAVNLFASRRRYALAIEAEPERMHATWAERLARPIPPVLVDDGPCHENVLVGEDVDLYRLSVPTWNGFDGGQFITMGCYVSKDPVLGHHNVGMYRAQVQDRQTLGILAAPYTHIMQQWAKRPNEPFPVALVIGADPSLAIMATTAFPVETDEMVMAGGLRQAPLELVRCRTIPLEVPAAAEIVIEAELHPGDLLEEGPFGEFAGYYGSRLARQAVRVKAITHRNQPIHHATYTGMPPHESALITGIQREAEILRLVPLAGLQQVHMTEAGCGAFSAIAQIRKQYEGHGKLMAMSILGTPVGRYIKQVTVVDEDVDPFDPMQVEWAVATRVQAGRDVEIITDVTGMILDPSLPEQEQRTGTARGSKLIVDATRYDAKSFPTTVRPDQATLEQVERNWDRYGIPLGGESSAPWRVAAPVPVASAG
jgi:2,5-furandicarboxylate decarboxylase 1